MRTREELTTGIKTAMRKLKWTEYDIEPHYEMLVLHKGNLSYLRAPDNEWEEADIPMDVLRHCHDNLSDYL